MWKDDIVEETRREREVYAAKFNNDLEAIARDLREKEQCSQHPIISLSPKQPAQFLIQKTARTVKS
jgi:hypothetical protein